MPADRRTMPTSTKPVKTERTHEENQERAYIAASRRSDRSLEARIESARRASEIHKKRTGRALRVTEQDVVNEEMYEEEDEDLPTQYQRLSAHLHTGSLMFNRKLHDYIATQHGVRNAFLQQYSNPPFPGYGPQANVAGSPFGQMQNPQMQQSPFQMLPPHMFSQAPQSYVSQTQPMSPTLYQQPQQTYRQSPYTIPQRPQLHQRAASISTPHQLNGFKSPDQKFAPATTQGDEQRRFSLPPQALDMSAYSAADDQSRPALSRGTTAQSIHQQQPVSPQNGLSRSSTSPPSTHGTPPAHQDNMSPSSYPFLTMNFDPSSQVLNMNPLSLSMPPESQQFLGNTLDPNDPRTAIFMAGSETLPQAFPKYTYNPNIGSKSKRADETATSRSTMSNDTNTPAMTPFKLGTSMDYAPSSYSPPIKSEGPMSAGPMWTSPSYDFSGLSDGEQTTQEDLMDNAFTDAFINTEAWGET